MKTLLETKKIGRPQKAERNRELVTKIDAGWTLRQLADFYRIGIRAIWEINQRDHNTYCQNAKCPNRIKPSEGKK